MSDHTASTGLYLPPDNLCMNMPALSTCTIIAGRSFSSAGLSTNDHMRILQLLACSKRQGSDRYHKLISSSVLTTTTATPDFNEATLDSPDFQYNDQ